MTRTPTPAEVDEAVEAADMDTEIANLSKWNKEPVPVLTLSMERIPPEVMHSVAEIAEVLNLPIITEYGTVYVKRPKTREELEQSVRSQIYSKLAQQYREEETDNDG